MRFLSRLLGKKQQAPSANEDRKARRLVQRGSQLAAEAMANPDLRERFKTLEKAHACATEAIRLNPEEPGAAVLQVRCAATLHGLMQERGFRKGLQ